jgi:hypothetical protein
VKTQNTSSSALTVAADPPLFAEACAPAAEAESVVVAFVKAEGASEGVPFVIVGPEGCSPLAARELVVDAVSSMGAEGPTDCASFTTWLVTCSAITVSGTVAAKDLLLESGSACVTEVEAEDVDGCASCPVPRSSSM